MKSSFIDRIKNSKFLYNLFYYTTNSFAKILSIFIKPRNNLVLFTCYGGRKYACNVRAIYEGMLNDSRFNGYFFIWAFRNPNQFVLPDKSRTKIIKIDSLRYLCFALKSRCWITNVSMQRGLNFKTKRQVYINTWHGFPFKYIGNNINDDYTFRLKRAECFDLFLADGEVDKEILCKAFNTKKCVITGYSRNDKMFYSGPDLLNSVRDRYSIPKDKPVILYAPTYRDYDKDENGSYIFKLNFDFKSFSDRFGTKYTLLFRAHGSIELPTDLPCGIINVSDYPDVEDLLVLSDILISDYSGVIPDFAILKKPIICYWFDYEIYKEKRGLYDSVVKKVPFKITHDFTELCSAIEKIDYSISCEESALFVERCGILFKNSTKRSLDTIYDELCRVPQKNS